MSETIEVFISYSKQDKELRDGLLAHLRPLEREGIITWHDRQILPNTKWDEEIRTRLNAADIILLLLSADFLNTDYCIQVEIPEALRRHETGEATVMPIILRHCAWKYTPLAAIQAYPEKAKPIKSWMDIDEAYTNVVDGVYRAATEIKKRRAQELRAAAEKLRQSQVRQRQAKTIDIDDLISDRHIDYTQLRDLLRAGDWREADRETRDRMKEAIARQQLNIDITNVNYFPCDVLRIIDQLWISHSQGRFGFSVQKRIWQECGSPIDNELGWKMFLDRVGWRTKHKGALVLKSVEFDISAPEGFLPLGLYWMRQDFGTAIQSQFFKSSGGFFSRVETCKL